ncbi:hypothetical protein O1611_g4373 [Lasiodiplodia mahajangana]|uniref:Uncharacterized protein n=1 Tax=Lasiodiplodia mahajangana TaxID=1108764 RepID=A0ACC2JP34_9PEZI|nr:hypothetical protein O1611_g4373 [Lasiodiplodia mahajangana]
MPSILLSPLYLTNLTYGIARDRTRETLSGISATTPAANLIPPAASPTAKRPSGLATEPTSGTKKTYDLSSDTSSESNSNGISNGGETSSEQSERQQQRAPFVTFKARRVE